MFRRACPFLWPALVLFFTSPLSSVADWTAEQRSHRSLRLTSALETMALLDQSSDPDADVLERLLQPMLVPRYVGSPGHEAVRQHIVATMSALGWEVDGEDQFEMQTPLGVRLFTNVVATHDPGCPRRLVLACHYDSIHGRDTFVAATDSAVPCAMMLHLAALLTERFLDPTKGRSLLSLQLMFLDGEEAFLQWSDSDSIYGARHLAEKLQRTPYSTEGGATVTQLDRMDMFVLLDLLGARDPVISNYMSSTEAEFRQLAGVEARLRRKGWLEDRPAVFRAVKSWGWSGPPQIGDDHLPFLERGVKILHVIPVPFPSVWHDDADDASIIDLPTVINLGRVLRVFVAEYLRLGELVPELESGHTEL